MSAYKTRLEHRRQQKILTTLSQPKLFLDEPIDYNPLPLPASAASAITDIIDDLTSPPPSLSAISSVGHDGVYHVNVAHDIQNGLVGSPIRRYGVLMGGRGSGKTLMLKRVADGKPYVAYVPFGLVSSVNSMVDTIAEEVSVEPLRCS